MNFVLEVKNLSKKFGDFSAVDNLNFSLSNGEILGLLGKNGAGKTTTIHMLLGITQPTTGQIEFFGKSLNKAREEIFKQINFSSTYISMPWYFTLLEILHLFANIYEIPNKKKRILKMVEEFEIEHLLKKQFYMLSAGEKTRLLLAKAFLNYPKIILLDEPTASLDPDIALKIREFLKKEKEEYNVSILLTSHNMDEVEDMCDRVMVIKNGKMIAQDTPENLAKELNQCEIHLVFPEFFEKAEKLFILKNIAFKKNKHRFILPTEEKYVAQLLELLAKENISYSEITINKPSLEDYFLEVMKEEKK